MGFGAGSAAFIAARCSRIVEIFSYLTTRQSQTNMTEKTATTESFTHRWADNEVVKALNAQVVENRASNNWLAARLLRTNAQDPIQLQAQGR